MTPDSLRTLRHELRTPINHIVGYADLILEDGEPGEGLAAGLHAVKEVASRLLTAIAGVVDGAGGDVPALSSLRPFVDELVGAAGALANGSVGRNAGDIERIRSATARLHDLVAAEAIAPSPDTQPATTGETAPGTEPAVLVVDDDAANREVLHRRLARLGYRVIEASNGSEALAAMRAHSPDTVLLDIMMPVLDGFGVLEARHNDPRLLAIPVIVISAVDDMASILRCIEAGAEDYLPKPFDPALLKARIGACVEKKRLRDQEAVLLGRVGAQAAELQLLNTDLESLVAEKSREVEGLRRLERFLPPQLAEVVRRSGETRLESHRSDVAILFCDLRGFTAFSETAEPEDVMTVLRELHEALVPLVFAHDGTLAQFTGDGMMVIFNDPLPCEDPVYKAVHLGIEMVGRAGELSAGWRRRGHVLEMGAGVATGFATCGRIGFAGRFEYTAIGQVVNLASRLCAEAAGGQVLVSERVLTAVEGRLAFEAVGELQLKGFARPVSTFNATVHI